MIPSAADLVRQARDLLAANEPVQAAGVYEKLQAAYPASSEAKATRVTLGELRLSLGEPAAALRAFDAYLASGGGTLDQEAQDGRIRTLRALGRTEDERRAIQDYLRSYPNSLQAAGLQSRLRQMDAAR
jgi:hypothetical protein